MNVHRTLSGTSVEGPGKKKFEIPIDIVGEW